MKIVKKSFGELKKIFKDSNIFFRVNGVDRHKDTDIIEYLNGCKIESYSAFLSGNRVCNMGAFSYSWSNLPTNFQVGRYCSIANGLQILGPRHPYEWVTTSSSTYDRNFVIFKKFCEDEGLDQVVHKRPVSKRGHGVIIHHDVWIGANVTLKPNIIIGTGAVIAANSLVTKDVPPYAIVGGNPAKVIKYRFEPMQIHDLLLSRWWDYKFTDFQKLDIRNIDNFINQFRKERDSLEILDIPELTLQEE